MRQDEKPEFRASKGGGTGGGILPHGEVDKSKVVEDLPLEWSKVDGSLQTANGLRVGGGERREGVGWGEARGMWDGERREGGRKRGM